MGGKSTMAWGLLAAVLAGCPSAPFVDTDAPTPVDTDDDTDAPIDPPPPTPPDPEPQPCDPALALDPPTSFVPVGTSAQLIASGGTGAWAFIASGVGAVNPADGAFFAGDLPGASTVTLTDAGCLGQASATITVTPTLQVAPEHGRVAPGTSFAFDVTGGSGTFTCDLVDGQGALAGCTWTAGAVGIDRIRVEDTLTGESREAVLEVVAGAGFSVRGAGMVAIPVGSTWTPEPLGGTGHLELTVDSGPFVVAASGITPSGEGAGTARIADRFTGLEVVVPLQGLGGRVPDAGFYGQRTLTGTVVSLGDLTGDGRSEVAVGMPELSLGGFSSGGVAIYASGPTGLAPDPVWLTGGLADAEHLGRAVLLHDHDQDGLPDLFLAADDADHFNTTNGSVSIHHGLPGGLFEEVPSTVLSGTTGGERFGSDLALCDFDGDGFQDLAVGAYGAEDLSVLTPATNQGEILIFRGTSTGLPEFPDLAVSGQVPDGLGGWMSWSNLNLGLSVDAGDLDGDGLCDLVAGSYNGKWDGATQDHGFVQVFRGTTLNGLVVERTPAAVYADDAFPTGQLGRWTAVGDLDGDGNDDLVLGHWRAGQVAGDGGAVHVFYGGSWPADPTIPILTTEADWWRGSDGGDFLGMEVQLGDEDGDGLADLWIGVPNGEIAGGTANSGTVELWRGVGIAGAPPGHDASLDLPDAVVTGPNAEGFFGQALAPVGDQDGDGVVDLVVLAGREELRGTDVPEAWFVGSTAGPVLLDLPDSPSGHEFGQGMAWLDADGDGADDLILGGSGDGTPAYGLAAGTLTVFADGGSTPTAHPLTHAGRGGGDRLGWELARIPDFDGDGSADLAVAVRNDSKPSTWSGFADPNTCPTGALSGSGAILVYSGSPLADTPSFVSFGRAVNDNVQELTVGDFDGDGLSDVGYGARGIGEGGGFGFVRGRAGAGAPLEVVCDGSEWATAEAGANLGPVAAIPDLDGDGCDELAAGAANQELGGATNRGAVWVLWGHGAACAGQTPEVSVFTGLLGGHTVGGSVAAGDLDGDGLAELVVGGWNRVVGGGAVGSVWVMPGDWIASAPRQAATDPLPETPTLTPVIPGSGPIRVVNGRDAGGRFGEAVAVIPDPVDPSRAALAVSAPRADVGGAFAGGGVEILRWEPGIGLSEVPWGLLVGEASRGELGRRVTYAGRDGAPTLLVGAPLSDTAGIDQGAGYVVVLP